MPVDRDRRDRAAAALAKYLRSEVDNFYLQDETFIRTKDEALNAVGWGIWQLYDDIRRHKVYATKDRWNFALRCIAFLKSDLEEAQIPRRGNDCSFEFAPFKDEQEWLDHRHLLNSEALPRYDPSVHFKPKYLYSVWDLLIPVIAVLAIIAYIEKTQIMHLLRR